MTNQSFKAGTSDPYTIKAGEIYAVELDRPLSPEEMETMRKQWQEATGAKVIFLSGAKLVRTATDADQFIQRVRDLHRPQATSTIDRCAECKKPSPCPTERALNGEQA